MNKSEVCEICGKNKATLLCDMPVNSIVRTKGKDVGGGIEEITMTCDKKICSECAIEIHKGIHFCKECSKVLRKRLTNRWIPMSERLPNIEECQTNDCRFIVTDGNRRYQAWFDYKNGYFDKCECNGIGLKKDNCVIAWQQLPEPYREEAAK